MWRNFSSWILLVCVLATAHDAAAARRRVLLTAEVNVPYTARWRNSGLLDRIKNKILNEARNKLEQFAYLEWLTAGQADVEVRLTIEQDPNSSPKGARPWNLRISRPSVDADEVTFRPIRVADAADVHELHDKEKPDDEVVEWFKKAMTNLDNDLIANHFVATVLRAIDVADDISPLKPNVLINVPKADLHANDLTRLRANFLRKATAGMGPVTVNLTLAPQTGAIEPSKTECSVIPDRVVGDYISAVENIDRTKRVSIFVSEYHRNLGSLRTGNRMETPP